VTELLRLATLLAGVSFFFKIFARIDRVVLVELATVVEQPPARTFIKRHYPEFSGL
jgi:hypothetical protein